MTWLRARAMPLVGILCLGGQGILLYAAGTATDGLALPWPWLFVALTVGLTLSLALSGRGPTSDSVHFRTFWRAVSLLGASALLGLGLAFILVGRQAPTSTPDESASLAAATAQLTELEPGLSAWWDEAGPLVAAGLAAADSTSSTEEETLARGGDVFRVLVSLPKPQIFITGHDRWGTVVWQGADRLAWSGLIEPLPAPRNPAMVAISPAWSRELIRGRAGWILRCQSRLHDERIFETQVLVTVPGTVELVPGVELVVGPIDNPAMDLDDSGLLLHQVGFGPDDTGPFAHLLARPESRAVRHGVVKARLLLAALVAWALVLAGLTRLSLGVGAGVLALWAGRWLLAASEALRWVGTAFPNQHFPATPDSWFSLVDPAYFATPFAWGWFASTADALLTAFLLAVTVWYILQTMGLVATADRRVRFAGLPLADRQDLLAGLGFGVVGGGVLLSLAFLARMVAENANPRLIGTGVSLDFLSFWGLQIVLMLLAFSLLALVAGLVAGAAWPERKRRVSWLSGGLVAAIVGLAVVEWGGAGHWWFGRMLVIITVAGTWFVAPALRARPRFLRRFAWPAIMLLAVAWNYGALRQVYDSAERTWLENKGEQITEADTQWKRALLAGILDGMVTRDQRLVPDPAGQDLWLDEAAWRLYRDSALSDLGYRCAVSLLDPADQLESFFALGFLTDSRYESVESLPWVDLSGRALTQPGGMMFKSERRRYAGGEEEVLVARVARADGQGWLRVELPVRSWSVATLLAVLTGDSAGRQVGYRPRAEIDRSLLLMMADNNGWLDTGISGIPNQVSDQALADLRAGRKAWAAIEADGETWTCLWKPLPPDVARGAGEGFLLGLRRTTWRENVLDISRLMLLNLVLFFGLFVAVQIRRRLLDEKDTERPAWRPGFQERFLAGYLLLGLVLLFLVGMTVDHVGARRVQAEARTTSGAGLARAVEQLRALLTEQATSLVDSDYIDDLMRGRLAGQRPVGLEQKRQGMVFGADGELLLDETLSDLSAAEASRLLAAARNSPMVVVRDRGELFVGTVIPIKLGDWIPVSGDTAMSAGRDAGSANGFFFYRQRLDIALINSLAELVHGQIILDVGGRPKLASHPAAVFAGNVPLLADPDKMIPVLDNPLGTSVYAAVDRPFAFTAGRPLVALARAANGELQVDRHPAVLNLAFPDRERDFANQRHETVLFLAGLANLILLTALVLALLMSWNIFRPVRLLLTATRSLAHGDFEAPLPDAGVDEMGRLAGAFATMRSELLTARDKLAARERFLSTVLNRVTVGVAVVDAAGEVVVLNPAGAHILTDFRPEVDGETGAVELMQSFSEIRSGYGAGAGELVSRDGRRTVRGALAPLELADGRTDTMLVFEDITEFLTTKKMAINAELARQVAHEIKNPLTPIQLSVQLLSQAWRDQHPQLDRIVPDTVDRVLQQVTLLRSIASEFSLLGRPGDLETTAVDLQVLVQEVTAAYGSGGAGSGSDHRVEIQTMALPPVRAHRESLQKILGNLMQNSLDAARPDDPLRIQVNWRVEPDSLTMVWQDNGTGLLSEVADRLFDPYFSTKSKGTGLGLVICRNLAGRMGGAITLGNRSGQDGAVAELTLPRVGTA